MASLQSSSSLPRRVFVSGAGGQTGQLVFRKLLSMPRSFSPVGVVRTEESRSALLQATNASPSSVVVCDITNLTACKSAMAGCDAAVICTSAKPIPTGATNNATGRPVFGFPNGQPEEVDWIGQKNQIDAAIAESNKSESSKSVHVVLCSSMGGTNPDHPLNKIGQETLADGTTRGGNILKWKRKAEMYLMNSGLPYTIVHPGGLINEPGGQRELCPGVDDKMEHTTNRSIPREDVAEVMVQALLHDEFRGRSFDLVSKPVGEGTVTKDFVALLKTLGEKNCDYSLGETA